jgi:hypothetical protein
MYSTEAHEAECRAVSTIQGQNVMHASDSPALYLEPLIHDAEVGQRVDVLNQVNDL